MDFNWAGVENHLTSKLGCSGGAALDIRSGLSSHAPLSRSTSQLCSTLASSRGTLASTLRAAGCNLFLVSPELLRKALTVPCPSLRYLHCPTWSSIKSRHHCPKRRKSDGSTLVAATAFPLSSMLSTGQIVCHMLFYSSHLFYLSPFLLLPLRHQTRWGGFVKERNQSGECCHSHCLCWMWRLFSS